jgi:hypothetical protein
MYRLETLCSQAAAAAAEKEATLTSTVAPQAVALVAVLPSRAEYQLTGWAAISPSCRLVAMLAFALATPQRKMALAGKRLSTVNRALPSEVASVVVT